MSTRPRVRGGSVAWRQFRLHWQAYRAWRVQGKPSKMPVVTQPGRIFIEEDGHGVVCDWSFDGRYMTTRISADDLVVYLRERYPERVVSL